MRIVIKLAVLCLALFFAQASFAQTKVAVVDLQSAIFNTKVAKKRLTELKNKPEYASLMAKFDGMKADLKVLGKDAEKNRATWSAEDEAEFRKKVEYKRADMQLAQQKLKAEQDAALQGILKELSPKAVEVFKQLIESEGVGLVLDRKSAVHVDKQYDLTAKVTTKLDKAK